MKKKTPYKIGLYIRVSTEEQAKNLEGSIKNQEQRLRQYVDFKNLEERFGEVAAVYVDRAKSGKNTNRPELQRMLRAIGKQEIDLVMVTELSRLSRSIKDFSEIWEMMQANHCGFLNLREQFDTTTAAGEMVLYTIANISQFERKQVSEHVSANFLARAKRGLYNGGSLPFGYRHSQANKGYLEVTEEEAEIVREAFRTYLDEGQLLKASRSLNDRGFRLTRKVKGGGSKARNDLFTVDNLQSILKNKSYIGVRVYIEAGEEKSVKACWEAVVEEVVFERVQKKLKHNYDKRVKLNSKKRYPFLLSGLAECGTCGDRLPGKTANGNGGKVPYYEHGYAVKKQASLTKKIFNCKPTRFPAKKLEPLVWDELTRLLMDPKVSRSLLEKARKQHKSQPSVSEADRLRRKVTGISEQLDALAEHLSKIPKGVSAEPVFRQMDKLQKLKDAEQKRLERLQIEGESIDEPVDLKDYRAFLATLRHTLAKTLSKEEQRKIIQLLVHKIEVFPSKIKIHSYIGGGYVEEQLQTLKNKQGTVLGTKKTEAANAASAFFAVSGSNWLTNGGNGRTRTSGLTLIRHFMSDLFIQQFKEFTNHFNLVAFQLFCSV